MVVLDAIHHIQAKDAPDLAVRWNCKAAKCGSCSAEVNGKPALMCKSRMDHMPEGQPIKELTLIDNEIIFPKSSSGVFNSTNIDYVLKNLGVRYLIISGVITDQCVDMAVRDAADRGYLVTLVEDACATYSQGRHDTALKAFGGYCWVSDTETVVKRLKELA